MILKVTRQFGVYLVSESQHYAMNTLMNMRYSIQKKLEPWVGRHRARRLAKGLIMLLEAPIKITLYPIARSNAT